jgi:hypothetical protein
MQCIFLRAQECEFAVVINFSLYAVLKVYICSFKSRVAAAPRGLVRVTKVNFFNNAKMLPFDVDKYFTWKFAVSSCLKIRTSTKCTRPDDEKTPCSFFPFTAWVIFPSGRRTDAAAARY